MYKVLALVSASILLIACSAGDSAVPRQEIEQLRSGKSTASDVKSIIGSPVSSLPMPDGSARCQWIFQQSGLSGGNPETKVMTATVRSGGILTDISVSGVSQ